jgi:hypothetical protein
MNENITNDERQELDRLRAQVAEMKRVTAIRFKVSEKGGLSVYGLGRFPVTLYRSQWERVIENLDGLKTFMAVNSSLLKAKI